MKNEKTLTREQVMELVKQLDDLNTSDMYPHVAGLGLSFETRFEVMREYAEHYQPGSLYLLPDTKSYGTGTRIEGQPLTVQFFDMPWELHEPTPETIDLYEVAVYSCDYQVIGGFMLLLQGLATVPDVTT